MTETARSILAINPTAMTSGAERVLVDYLTIMAESGWSVRCASPDGPLRAYVEAAGLAWEVLPDMKLPAGNKLRAMGRMAGSWKAAATRISELAESADVVLTNGLMGLPALRLARLSVPVVWLVHDVVVRTDLQLIVRGAAGAVDRAIAVSECSAAFPRAAGIESTVVLNGTPFPLPRAPVTMPTPPVVGVSAVLTPWKGHVAFLDAVAQVVAHPDLPDVRVEIMGGTPAKDGEYVAELRARAEQPDLAGRVTFLGHVDDPVGRLRTWALAVSPSIDPEACPLNVLEAMSVGVPMVVTDHGGAAELIGDAGRKVTPRDPDALAAGIIALLTDADEHRRMRLRGPEIIDAGHRAPDVGRRFTAVIEDIVSSAP